MEPPSPCALRHDKNQHLGPNMNKHLVGWSSLLGCCNAGLAAWYLYSMFQFHHGWIRLDPLCVKRGDFRMPVYSVDRLYTPEAAFRLRDVIATEYSEEAVYVDDRGAVHIRPMLYYGNLLDLDRFGQLVLRPEDRPSLP